MLQRTNNRPTRCPTSNGLGRISLAVYIILEILAPQPRNPSRKIRHLQDDLMRRALQVGEALLHHTARDSSRAFNVVAGLDAQPQYPTHKPRSRPACKRPACKHGLMRGFVGNPVRPRDEPGCPADRRGGRQASGQRLRYQDVAFVEGAVWRGLAADDRPRRKPAAAGQPRPGRT